MESIRKEYQKFILISILMTIIMTIIGSLLPSKGWSYQSALFLMFGELPIVLILFIVSWFIVPKTSKYVIINLAIYLIVLPVLFISITKIVSFPERAKSIKYSNDKVAAELKLEKEERILPSNNNKIDFEYDKIAYEVLLGNGECDIGLSKDNHNILLMSKFPSGNNYSAVCPTVNSIGNDESYFLVRLNNRENGEIFIGTDGTIILNKFSKTDNFKNETILYQIENQEDARKFFSSLLLHNAGGIDKLIKFPVYVIEKFRLQKSDYSILDEKKVSNGDSYIMLFSNKDNLLYFIYNIKSNWYTMAKYDPQEFADEFVRLKYDGRTHAPDEWHWDTTNKRIEYDFFEDTVDGRTPIGAYSITLNPDEKVIINVSREGQASLNDIVILSKVN